MSGEQAQSVGWQGDTLKSPYFQHIIKFAICRNIDTVAKYDALAQIVIDRNDIDELKEVLFYLEHTNWNISQSKLLLELDSIDRAGPPTDSGGNIIDNHATNPALDTRIAGIGADFDSALCKLKIVVDGVRRTFIYPKSKTLNENSQDDVDELNRWRHRLIRQYVGIPNAGRQNGQSFHPLEVDYLLNRYAAQDIDHKGHCRYGDITEDYNAVFEDVYLPGRSNRLMQRSQESITSILTRRAVNPQEAARRWPNGYNGLMRHDAAQERIKKEWNERFAANEQENENECEDQEEREADDDQEDVEIDEYDSDEHSEYQEEEVNEEANDD